MCKQAVLAFMDCNCYANLYLQRCREPGCNTPQRWQHDTLGLWKTAQGGHSSSNNNINDADSTHRVERVQAGKCALCITQDRQLLAALGLPAARIEVEGTEAGGSGRGGGEDKGKGKGRWKVWGKGKGKE